MQEVEIADAARHLRELFEAALKGERIVIKAENSAVELVPVRTTLNRRRFGSARGVFEMKEDFDLPLSDFDEYRK
ncbi:MAG: hypothetical protein DIJKHBIC_03816 [Thermoanaerobaculia bacterium]|nr:hypothetical protein [Thermoanaerobaculia bacterium]